MQRKGAQGYLFMEDAGLPQGFVYRPDFLTREEEADIIGYLEDLPLEHPVQEGYAAYRRVMNFGWSYDFARQKLVKGPPLPPFLRPLQRKIAKWLDVPVGRVVEALVTEYSAGAAIGWHRDNETFDAIIGISLAGPCLFRLRPIASRVARDRRLPRDVISFPLSARSAYLMQGDTRWLYQHSIPKVAQLRYSITFRTLPAGPGLRNGGNNPRH